MADAEKARHIGVLVVHGVGEQGRFDTARGLARALAGSLAAEKPPRQFALKERVTEADIGTQPPTCPSPDKFDSPYEIIIAEPGRARTHIHIHEVWWADLGAASTVKEQLQFWRWGLGQWGARLRTLSGDAGGTNTDRFMFGPRFRDQASPHDYAPYQSFRVRTLLFLTAMLTFLTLITWSLVKRLASWLTTSLASPTILTQYIGDVRTYTTTSGIGGGTLEDVGQPWRTTIRRRMVRELVAMAERDYDRWFVLGHSLGSVVAFNGLQETETCLPNYLDEGHANRLRTSALWTKHPYAPEGAKTDLLNMMPRRPLWLGETDGISRAQLFRRLGGFVTYGSPLDKFAALWPRIVGLNKQPLETATTVEWVNLIDVTDPIGGKLDAFDGVLSPVSKPVTHRIRTSPWLLIAHVRYFLARKPKPFADTPQLLKVLDGSATGLSDAFKPVAAGYGSLRARRTLALAQIFVLAIFLVAGAALVALGFKAGIDAAMANAPGPVGQTWVALKNWVANQLPTWAASGLPAAAVFVVGATCLVVLSSGLWRRLSERDKSAVEPPTATAITAGRR